MSENTFPRKTKFKLIVISIFGIGLFGVFFAFGGSISESTRECLIFCATSLVPSLFPLMCASGILLQSPASRPVGRMLYPLCKRLFGLSQNGSYVWVIGNLCGYPIGAQNAYELYCDNKISNDELDFLIIFSSTPSSAFVISAIGVNILKSKSIGICLYICTLLSCVITGIIYRWVYLGRRIFSGNIRQRKKRVGFSQSFCNSIRMSTQNMLYICGFVVFFNLLCNIFLLVAQRADLPQAFAVIVSGLMELSSGARYAGKLSFPFSALLCALFVGWSGFCVHMQIFSVCKDARISYARFFLWRGVIAIICLMLFAVAIYFGFV